LKRVANCSDHSKAEREQVDDGDRKADVQCEVTWVGAPKESGLLADLSYDN
jgi:hypothetical protein